VALACVWASGCGGTSPRGYAAAVNLRPGDIPGFAAGITPKRPVTSGPLTASIERCDGGIPGPRGIVGYSSRRLLLGRAPSAVSPLVTITRTHPLPPLVTARSVVYTFANEASALRELAVVSSARARACIRAQLEGQRVIGEASGTGSGETKPLNGRLYTHIELAPLSTPFPRSYGLRDTRDDSFFPGPPRREHYDFYGFVRGRALVALYTVSVPRPFPPAAERHLLSLLYSRAQTQ
jgi:hypothetical protein